MKDRMPFTLGVGKCLAHRPDKIVPEAAHARRLLSASMARRRIVFMRV